MQIYIEGRQSGKTTMLIEMSEKTGATIVVATYPMANYIQLLAAQMGKKIPVPITVTNYIRLLARGGLGKKDGVRRVDPVSIKFCDEENANLCALVKHNEALRKGEANVEN